MLDHPAFAKWCWMKFDRDQMQMFFFEMYMTASSRISIQNFNFAHTTIFLSSFLKISLRRHYQMMEVLDEMLDAFHQGFTFIDFIQHLIPRQWFTRSVLTFSTVFVEPILRRQSSSKPPTLLGKCKSIGLSKRSKSSLERVREKDSKLKQLKIGFERFSYIRRKLE